MDLSSWHSCHHLVVFVAAGLLFGCDCGNAGDRKTQRQRISFGVQAMDESSKQSAAHSSRLGWFNALVMSFILGMMNLSGTEMYLLMFASFLYFVGVQWPTFRINIPLNNSVQALDIESLDESEAALSRVAFEIPWNRWNRVRTVNAVLTVSILLLLLSRY